LAHLLPTPCVKLTLAGNANHVHHAGQKEPESRESIAASMRPDDFVYG